METKRLVFVSNSVPVILSIELVRTHTVKLQNATRQEIRFMYFLHFSVALSVNGRILKEFLFLKGSLI